MKSKFKRVIATMLALMMVFGMLAIGAYADNNNSGIVVKEAGKATSGAVTFKEGKSIIFDVDAGKSLGTFTGSLLFNKDSDTIIASERISAKVSYIETEASRSGRSLPDKQTSVTYAHKINDRNGILMATVYTTVTAIYSEVDRYVRITSMKYQIEKVKDSYNFTCTTSYSGAEGYLYVYLSGISAGTFKYIAYYNGNIVNV